jgi:hypothetical protein
MSSVTNFDFLELAIGGDHTVRTRSLRFYIIILHAGGQRVISFNMVFNFHLKWHRLKCHKDGLSHPQPHTLLAQILYHKSVPI